MKTHLRGTKKNPGDWKQSPHIYEALSLGLYAACTAGIVDNGHITEEPEKVTCKACRYILAGTSLPTGEPQKIGRKVRVDMGYGPAEHWVPAKVVDQRTVSKLFGEGVETELLVETAGGERAWVSFWEEIKIHGSSNSSQS